MRCCGRDFVFSETGPLKHDVPVPKSIVAKGSCAKHGHGETTIKFFETKREMVTEGITKNCVLKINSTQRKSQVERLFAKPVTVARHAEYRNKMPF